MGQTTDKIETFIESQRSDLGSNLEELEHKVKSATDWRQHFQKSPMTMMGFAWGGGVFLATLLPRRSNMTRAPGSLRRNDREDQTSSVLQTFVNIKGALIGVAATRFTDILEDFIPGFREHLDRQREGAPS